MNSKERIEIMLHTSNNGRYVSDHNHDMAYLVETGLLKDYGPQSLAAGAHYYVTTPKGRQAISDWSASQPKPPPISKRKQRAKERFNYWLNGPSCNWKFGQWLKLGAPGF